MDAALQDSGSFLKKTAMWESPPIPPEITLTGPFFSALTQCQQMEGQLGSLSLAPTNATAPFLCTNKQLTPAFLPLSHVCPHGPDRPGPHGRRGVLVSVTAAISVAGPAAQTQAGRLCQPHPHPWAPVETSPQLPHCSCPTAGGSVWHHGRDNGREFTWPCLPAARLLVPCRALARPPLSWAVRPALTLNVGLAGQTDSEALTAGT